ncbi:MAG: phosphoribosylamine--glycine ligase [Actinomycetota bacterium]
MSEPAGHRRVLLVGGGGREHALAEALSRSPRLERLVVAPGNAGTAEWNVELDVADHAAVVAYCAAEAIDLVVVGPEAPLVAGLVDDLAAAGVAAFGPSARAATLEGSKARTREFADRWSIPSPRSASFLDVVAAEDHVRTCGYPVVVKADGLAAGKGVIVPDDEAEALAAVRSIMHDRSVGDAGARVVLEERLAGPEVSLIGLCDGARVVAMPPAQDHKRALDGDRGPNTGGMGAFAPTPTCSPELAAELTEVFLQRAVDGLAAEGTPYVGALYAGLMLTDDGPRLLEYNCRFGDPEAQVLLPLVDTPLLDVVDACVTGSLDPSSVEVSAGAAATVVVASGGYPGPIETGRPITGIDEADEIAAVFHAGTVERGGQVVTSGGRVLAVTGVGGDLGDALDRAYAGVERIGFEGAQHRTDIGAAARRHRAASPTTAPPVGGDAYAAAGVDIAAGEEAVDRIARRVAATHDHRVLRGIGSFGGAMSLAAAAELDDPVLVASTDGVGTKTLLAAAHDRWEVVGADIVHHGVDDVLVQGARPLAFLDTVAAGRLDPAVVERIVGGMADACLGVGCVLLGGETAEMPGVLEPDAVDVAGTMLGLVDRGELLPRSTLGAGHVLVGLAADGLHTNGWSLVRRLLADRDLTEPRPGGDIALLDELLVSHRSYLAPLDKALGAGLIDGLAHITGGGIPGNLSRVLTDGVGAEVDLSTWEIPALQRWLIDEADISIDDASTIWNLGIGMIAVVHPERLDELLSAIDEPVAVVGELTAGAGVRLRHGSV